jgi:hypothetical protein
VTAPPTTTKLRATWKNYEVPVHVGQRLLAVRTHTANRTLYLFDHDGERPGWVSGDELDLIEWVPSHDEVYIAVVTDVVRNPHRGAFFEVMLAHTQKSKPEVAQALRRMAHWPDSLGEPGAFEDRFKDLYSILITRQPGAPKGSELPSKESNIMNTSSKSSSIVSAVKNRASRTFSDNAEAMKNAGYLEAGTIVNRQLTKLASAKLPLMVRGYADTPIGKLIIANLFKVAIHELRPDNHVLQRLSDASLEAAHLDVIRTLDIDGLIDDMLSDETFKRALSKLEGAEGGAQ